MIFSLASMALIGGLSLITFTKSFGIIFLGSPRTHLHQQPTEVKFSMRVPQYLIVTLMLSIGLFPQLYFPVVNKIISNRFLATLSVNTLLPVSFLNSIASVGKYAILFITLSVLICLIRFSFYRRRTVVENTTWGCGYSTPNARMQYTGKSFSKSLGKLMNFVVLERKKYKEISTNEIFPAERKYSSHFNDLFVVKFINGTVNRLFYSLNYFQFIQNGKIQMYILYGVFFIFLIFLGTIFKFI
jgi:hypothetical protein